MILWLELNSMLWIHTYWKRIYSVYYFCLAEGNQGLWQRDQPNFEMSHWNQKWDVVKALLYALSAEFSEDQVSSCKKNDIIPPCTRKENIKTRLRYNKLEDLKKSSIVNRSEFNLLYIVAFAYWSWRRRKWKGTGRKHSKVLTKLSQGIMTLVTRKRKKRLCMTIDILTWKYGKVYFSKFLIILLSIEYYCGIF